MINYKINHFWAPPPQKKNSITVNWSCVQKVWIFTLKLFQSIWLLLESLRKEHVQLVMQGLATWLVLVPCWEQLRGLHVRVSVATCTCSLEGKAFYMFQHVISSPALPSQSRCCCFLVEMWETRDSCMVRSTAIFNQLQMFPVKPTKHSCAPQLCCKVGPCCKINF